MPELAETQDSSPECERATLAGYHPQQAGLDRQQHIPPSTCLQISQLRPHSSQSLRVTASLDLHNVKHSSLGTGAQLCSDWRKSQARVGTMSGLGDRKVTQQNSLNASRAHLLKSKQAGFISGWN